MTIYLDDTRLPMTFPPPTRSNSTARRRQRRGRRTRHQLPRNLLQRDANPSDVIDQPIILWR